MLNDTLAHPRALVATSFEHFAELFAIPSLWICPKNCVNTLER